MFFQRTLIEKLPFLLVNNLLLSIPLLALSDRQSQDKLILVGLGNLTRILQVNDPSISMAQGSQLVSPAPWPLTSQRDNEIYDFLQRYVQYHPVICQILQILSNKQETQPEVWSCTTKNGHNNPLASIMCRPHRAIHS
jgi:hypothetical protein